MALELDTTLDPIYLARNPVVLQLRSHDGSDGSYPAKGAAALLNPGSGDRFATGGTLTVTYTEADGTTEAIVFTAAASYSGEAQIPDNSFAGSNTAYWQAVADKISDHHRISPFFTVTYVPPSGGTISILVRAISVEAGWVVTMTNSAGFSVSASAVVADITPVNYRVLLEVFFEKTYRGGDYVQAARLDGLPDQDGLLYFDISSILAAQCKAWRSEPLVPEYGQATPARADNLRRFYVRYTEEYGTPVEAQEWQYSGVTLTLDGGVSQTVFAQGNFFDGLGATNSLLTWMPDGRSLGLLQPEYLSWFNYTGADKEVILQLLQYDVDNGSAATPEYFYDLPTKVTVRARETLLIPVSPDLLDLASDRYKIALRVVDFASDWEGGDPDYLSQARTYFLDRDYYRSSRYVQYLNSFGVPECWRCTGEWGERLRVRRDVAQRVLQPGFNAFAADTYQYGSEGSPTLTFRTGYLRKSEAQVLQEMLISGEIYDVSEDGYIPLRLTTNEFDVTDTDRTLHAYQFAAEPRMAMGNFSKILLTGATDANAWQEPGGASWFNTFLIPWTTP